MVNFFVPVDGLWSDWSEWGICSITCGQKSGMRTKMRFCNNPQPQFGGQMCIGDTQSSRPCQQDSPCPSKYCLLKLTAFHNNKDSCTSHKNNVYNCSILYDLWQMIRQFMFFVGTSIPHEGASTRPNKIVTVENEKGDQITDDTSTMDVILYALIPAGAFVVRLHPEGMLSFKNMFHF